VSSVSLRVQACRWLGMASKDPCEVCEKPFYGKQKFIRCSKCDLRFHCNCLQTGVTETNVNASTGKSTYKCDSCKKLTEDTTNEHSIARSNQKEELPTEIQLRVLGIMILLACSWKRFAQIASVPWRWYSL
jgi:hypothetical protein